MNTAVDLLTNLQSMGVSLSISGDKIRVKAPVGSITPDMKQSLTIHKAEIISLLEHRSRRPSNARTSVVVWSFRVDGKRITGIDPERLCETDYLAFLDRKFGSDRVSDLQRQ